MSSTTSPITRYHGVAILLHWLLAAALIGIFVLGSYMTDLPFSPQRLQLYSWHKWAGVVILLLSALRLFWRLTHRPPALPAQIEQAMPRWQVIAHHATHHGLYLLFFAVPLIGWAYSSAAGFPIVLFGVLPLPDFVPVDKALARDFKELHEAFSWALMVMVALHVAAAAKHQFIDRDGLIARMWPGRG
jgi:cytochrome b561